MDRTKFLIDILEATAHKQQHISVILEAKAIEASKARNWLLRKVSENQFDDHDHLLKHCSEVHEQLIEVIEAMTKMESSLAKNLKIALGQQDENQSFGGGLFGLDGSAGGLGGLGGSE